MRALLTHGVWLIAGIIPVFTLSGCMVGPDFHRPRLPQVSSYTETKLPAKTVASPSAGKSGQAQTFLQGKDLPAEWWHLYRSDTLNQLISRGIANSPNLTASYAALRVAQETLNAQIGNSLFPAADLNASGLRNRTSGAQAGRGIPANIFNIFNTSVAVSYTFDLFGGQRREIEALRAQVDYSQFQLIAAYLTLTTNIVTTVVASASYEAQITATHELIKSQSAQLDILRKQLKLGGVSLENVLAQETLVEQTRATLPPLEFNLSKARNALAVLVGAYPNEKLPTVTLNQLTLPSQLPISIPSNLVRQRPDVRASEALLHAATAGIGVATANLFPQFTLSAYGGWESGVASTLFTPAAKVWSYGGGLTQPLFHGGALFAQRRQAIAAYDQAGAQYQQTVLQAFESVADVLRALETDAQTLQAQKRAEIAAKNNLIVTRNAYKVGGTSFISLLNAEQQYQSVKIAVVQAEATRYSDTAALFQALGGGWWHKPWCVKECL